MRCARRDHRVEKSLTPDPGTPLPTETLPNRLLEMLLALLGPENVEAEPGQLEVVSRTSIPYQEIPAIAVYPISTEQVQVVVRLAREFDVLVWPVSTGKNWGYGEKTACYPGGMPKQSAARRTRNNDRGLIAGRPCPARARRAIPTTRMKPNKRNGGSGQAEDPGTRV